MPIFSSDSSALNSSLSIGSLNTGVLNIPPLWKNYSDVFLLWFVLVIWNCHGNHDCKRLTKWPAMLHDNAWVERAWERVSWRGERPLIVTHWAHSTSWVSIHCYLALRRELRHPGKVRNVRNTTVWIYISWSNLSYSKRINLFWQSIRKAW